ncbi:hypothetical protein SAMN03159444_02527 [Pseudomonas sp. NFACC02]|uniref:hypothetical protein n=1 Tax=Pseudomonas sp. NFACC02 TaxID=1566250 RepID=UPI0008C77026|nr:hypothetical protein [Pseudomonas sp. NFACC02]SEQ81714.1 hypothetical protein SAMN03159444_02527 [Pseudomonas sp. NFACC02]
MNQGTIEGHINAGCVVFMSAACSDQQKKDVMDCTLYTQLAASKRHSRFDAALDWRHTWLAALNRFGWAVRSHDSRSLPAAEVGRGTVWDWVDKQLPAFIPKSLFAEGAALATCSVKEHPDQPAVAMLNRQVIETSFEDPASGVSERKIALQLAVFEPTTGLGLMVLSFTTRQPSSAELLVEVFNPEEVRGNIEMAFYSARVMEIVYAQFREKINQALNDRRAGLIYTLQEVRDVQPQ